MITPQDQIGGYTPTPWRADRSYVKGVDGFLIADTDRTAQPYSQARDNAAFIVRAVNAHDTLVAALRDVHSSGADCVRNAKSNHSDVIIARSAWDSVIAALSLASRVGAL